MDLSSSCFSVRALRKKYPDHPIIADLKTMDAGFLEAEMMFKAGANFVVVMGVAHRHSIREAVRAARQYKAHVMGDIMLHPDKPAIAKQMQEFGLIYFRTYSPQRRRRSRRRIGPEPPTARPQPPRRHLSVRPSSTTASSTASSATRAVS